jgi:hypothetical protein
MICKTDGEWSMRDPAWTELGDCQSVAIARLSVYPEKDMRWKNRIGASRGVGAG